MCQHHALTRLGESHGNSLLFFSAPAEVVRFNVEFSDWFLLGVLGCRPGDPRVVSCIEPRYDCCMLCMANPFPMCAFPSRTRLKKEVSRENPNLWLTKF